MPGVGEVQLGALDAERKEGAFCLVGRPECGEPVLKRRPGVGSRACRVVGRGMSKEREVGPGRDRLGDHFLNPDCGPHLPGTSFHLHSNLESSGF